MGSVRRRLERLEEKSGYQRMTLVCPECEEEFTVYGDAGVEYIVWEWARESGSEEGHHKTPESMLRAFEHEHNPGALLEKRSGLPFLSKAVSGIDIGVGPSRDV